ncbi:MAG TPA: hypothetical protein VK949_08390 [Methylotenera sp.]|nr:hypothetical protein [Methylotenera sp.]
MPESPSTSTSGISNPEELMLKDVLKPSIFIIALQGCCLLFCWYFFVFKPALNQSNPMDISLTKKPYSNIQVSEESTFKTELETQLADNFEPSQEAISYDEKLDVIQRNNPTHTKLIQRNISIKSTKTNLTKSGKMRTAKSHESSDLQNRYKKDKKHRYMTAKNNRFQKGGKGNLDQDEDMAQKIKSFAVNLKESFLIPATMPVCTQVQNAMNQCTNYSS